MTTARRASTPGGTIGNNPKSTTWLRPSIRLSVSTGGRRSKARPPVGRTTTSSRRRSGRIPSSRRIISICLSRNGCPLSVFRSVVTAFVASCVASGFSRTIDAQSTLTQPPANMAAIPAGEFWMGRTHTATLEQAIILERDRRDDQPAHKIHIDAFYLDKNEVTNADYLRFVEATGAARPWYWPGGKVAKGEERFPV